jgi:hypothetical protein
MKKKRGKNEEKTGKKRGTQKKLSTKFSTFSTFFVHMLQRLYLTGVRGVF